MSDDVKEDIRDIRNDIERIKSDTHNINRIITIANPIPIVNDLKKIIGTSVLKVAVLHLSKNPISPQDLASALKTDPKNLTKYVKEFVDRGYISELKNGREKIFVRSEILDQLNFETIPDFAKIIKSWNSSK
ncbi:hypothetical protein [Nitrosopumilus sp.]|uniref:hypothetical protein n=1 Tax=Nitrosopumilus sp. TaxID=2024843 RepID=UPI003D131922